MQQVTTRGIDIAKNVLQLHGVNARGKTILQKRLSRNTLVAFIANLPACRIGMEASGGAHYWARECTKRGHEVKRMAPQYVTPSVQGNKNDEHDAAAIWEAVSRPRRRCGPIKSVAHQDMPALPRIRERQSKMRPALVHHIRGLLSEYGIVMPKGVARGRITPLRSRRCRQRFHGGGARVVAVPTRRAAPHRHADCRHHAQDCAGVGLGGGVSALGAAAGSWPVDSDRLGGGGGRGAPLQAWASARGGVGAGAEATLDWRQADLAGDQQTGK